VVDLSSRNSPSYSVQILEQHSSGEPFEMTLYWVKLPQVLKEWWYDRRVDPAIEVLLQSPERVEKTPSIPFS
jgi:hypothetical protein